MKADERIPYPAIPLAAGQVSDWRNIPIKEDSRDDSLVPLGPLSSEAAILTTSSIYFGEHSNSPYMKGENKIDGSLLTVFSRRSVARRLVAAEQLLPVGHHLLVFDAYRPFRVQNSLYNFYKQKLREKHPDAADEVLESETQKYVSLPSHDPIRPSPHSTGGAVDVVIIKLDEPHENELCRMRGRLANDNLDFVIQVSLEIRVSALIRRHGRMLVFGTAFDHGGEQSALAYYESKGAAGGSLTEDEALALNNRRLLFNVMTQAGFQSYYAEWWHFNAPESQMGAATAGRHYATFGAMELDSHNLAHEAMRVGIYEESVKLYKGGGAKTDLQAEIRAALRETGDPRRVKDWPTEIIAPEE